VQAVCYSLVKLGFYDIKTFECLSKNYENEQFYFNKVYGEAEEGEPEDK